jgi:hypothetical protein
MEGGEFKQMAIKLSDKAKENLRRNEQSRNQQSKFVKLQSGEKMVLHFDVEKIEPVEMEFDGKKTIRYQYTVTDSNDTNQTEKYITFSKSFSSQVDTLLEEGHTIIKVHRIGAGKDTQYMFTPA